MEKREVIAFFEEMASAWDSEQERNEEVINSDDNMYMVSSVKKVNIFLKRQAAACLFSNYEYLLKWQ